MELLRSLLFEIKLKKAKEFSSIFKSKLDSSANSYKAREYLLADVSENP